MSATAIPLVTAIKLTPRISRPLVSALGIFGVGAVVRAGSVERDVDSGLTGASLEVSSRFAVVPVLTGDDSSASIAGGVGARTIAGAVAS
ncbi:MAG: hypothetical protein ACE5KO_06340, partial [Candidatus Bathyarchaeia archaeon]